MAAPQPETISLQTYTIPANNLTIRVGDDVVVRPNTDEELPYVGKILRILADLQMTNATVKVRWYYRPEDTRQGRRLFHGLKELLFSEHISEELHVECINGKCIVHSFKDYQRLELVVEEDYFWRFKYECREGIIVEEQVEVFCFCAMPLNPDLRMILCEGCLEWFHLRCLNMSLEESIRIPHFYCQMCKTGNHGRRCERHTARSK